MKNYIWVVIFLSFIFLFFAIQEAISTTQYSFLLDLDDANFNYTRDQFNDSSPAKNLTFSGSQNLTAWLTIPKNSTIVSSSIGLEGVMKPIQSSTTNQINCLSVGNVVLTNAWDEIVIGTTGGGGDNIKLLNSSGSTLWSSSGISDDVLGVDIGNLSSESGNEVVGGDTTLYLFNSSGSQKWNTAIGSAIQDVEADDVLPSDDYDEIAVASADNKIYLFDEDGSQLWNYSGASLFRGVGIGNLSSENGNEVVGGSGNIVYMLNSTGSEKWNVDIGTSIKDVDAENVLSNYDYDEIAVAGNNGTVFLLNSTGDLMWAYTTTSGSPVDTVSIGDVTTEYSGNEIVAGAYDDKVYVLNTSGDLVWSYTAEIDVRGVGVGNLTSDTGSEVVAGTILDAFTNYMLYILNFEYYPTDSYLDIGDDGDSDWQYSGKFRSTDTASGNSEFQGYLSSCTADSSGNCDVPLVFHSDFAGTLNLTNISVNYTYSISNMVSYSSVTAWSRTNNVRVNETVGSKINNITYSQNPASSIQVRYVTVNDSASSTCDFNGTSYSVATISGTKVCNITTPRTIPASGSVGYDWVWDDQMSSGIPLYKNESSGASQAGYWKKNATIWNQTTSIFTNVIANTSLDEVYVVGNSALKVDWYNNGTYFDITPGSSQSNCNSDPTYTSMPIGSDNFAVCKQDTNSNGVVDFFIWKQPNTNRPYAKYEVSGSSNYQPSIINVSVEPSSASWGNGFNFTVNLNDSEGNNVTVQLCFNYTNKHDAGSIDTGNVVWECLSEKNTTGNTTLGESLLFNVSTNMTWTGINLYRLKYRDFNGSTVYHAWVYTTLDYAPNTTRHNTTVSIVQGNGTSVNRGESTALEVLVKDRENSQPINNANCTFWITTNGSSWDSGYQTQSNATGYCTYDFTANSSYLPGQQKWRAGIYDDIYYQTNISTNYTIDINGKMSINITQSTFSSNATRNQTNLLVGKLYDEYGDVIQESGYNCSWYLNSTFLGSALTNSSGYCSYSWSPGCPDNLAYYTANLTVNGSGNSYYSYYNNNHTKNFYLKDDLALGIISPSSGQIFHKNDTLTLDSYIFDSCGVPSESYTFVWGLNCTTESGLYPPSYTTETGDNTTWTIACFPGILEIKPQAAGDFYNLNESNMSVDIYGWAEVELILPTNGTYNRTETNRVINISCRVNDVNNTNVKIDGYTVDMLKKYESQSYTKLTTVNTVLPGGFANYTWNISSNSTAPEGNYIIKCNISNQEINAYKKFNVTTSEESAAILLIETDTTAPSITGYSADSVLLGSNVLIEVNATDWYGVDKAWINLSYPDGTSNITFFQNTSPTTNQGFWTLNITDADEVGDYDYVIYVNDTSNYTSNQTGWFEVYQTIQMFATTDYPVMYTLYRPGTSMVVHTFQNTSGSQNLTWHKRNYDFLAKIDDAPNQLHSVKFNDMNSTATSETQFGVVSNVTNPLNLTNMSLSLLDPPVPYRHELAALRINTNLVFSNLTVYLNYTGQLSAIDYEPAIAIYKCSQWNSTSSSCDYSWARTNSTINTTSHVVQTTQTNASVYYAFEPEICGNNICGSGESCSNCPGDCGECGSGDGSPGGGPGGSGDSGDYEAVCGNGVCDPGETASSCYQDCGDIIEVKTNLSQSYITPGVTKNYALWIKNKQSGSLDVSISLTGQISSLLNLNRRSITIPASEEEEVILSASVPNTASDGAYSGEILITALNITERVPVSLTVSSIEKLQVSVKSISNFVRPNETIMFEVNIYSFGEKIVGDFNLSYFIRSVRGDDLIYAATEQKLIRTPEQFIKNVFIPRNTTLGEYYMVLNVSYAGQTITATDNFEVRKNIFTTKPAIIIYAVLGTGLLAWGMVYGRKKFIVWKLSKKRYIFPVDFKLLPKGNLNIGKIAESDESASYDMNDLTTHILVAGATGAGKSVSASVFAEELLEKKLPVVVFDPTAQWTGFMRPCRDEKILKFYPKHGLKKENAKSYPGNIHELTDPDIKIDFKKFMNPGEITVFVMNKLSPEQYDTAVRNIVDSIFRQSWEESTELQLVIVLDEVHRLLEKYGGKGGYVALEKACREFRKWGIGLIMASQVLSDFKEAIKGNVLTELQMHTKSLGDLQRIEKKYGLEFARRVAKEEVGIGMMQNPKYNKGLPWFISFRPPLHMPHKIKDEELRMYKEYNSKIRIIEQEILKMEKAGGNVFELKIEAKLARDKLKKGMFRVAQIYIESLNKKLGIKG